MVDFHENFVVATLRVQELISKIKLFFLIYNVPMVMFQKFKEYFSRTIHTLCGYLFHAFTRLIDVTPLQL